MKTDTQHMGFATLVLALLPVFFLAACARPGPPAPVVYGGSGHYSRAVDESRAPMVTPSRIEVQRGDTLYAISRRYQVPVKSVIELNDLEPPYHLRVGQSLRLPAPRVHTVARGDTVYGISRRYGVDMSALARLNNIEPPYTITVGQRLVLPGGTQVMSASRESPAPATAASAGRPAQGAESGSERTPDAAADRQRQAATQPAAIPQTPARAGGRFLWPLEGEVLLGFGPAGHGLHNDGINIAAPMGAPVRAAENGVVVYSGNELRGFGNILLIKHEENWMTAYAHLSEALVQRGETVRRGQTIARVGDTGNVSRPQLHFEIRRGARAVDPKQYLEPQVALGQVGFNRFPAAAPNAPPGLE